MIRKSLLVVLVFLAGCSSPIKNTDSVGKAIVCFGDSITYGTGSAPGYDYPSYLKALSGKEVINAGASGDTTATALNRLESDVIASNPYLVIVEIGGNDLLRGVSKKETFDNIEKIINRIQQGGAIVALCDTSGAFFFRGYKNDYKKLAKKTGSIFVPGLLSWILEDSSLKYDQVHPNSKGYKIIAQRVYKAIKPYMKEKRNE